jgi:hypothetical protein
MSVNGFFFRYWRFLLVSICGCALIAGVACKTGGTGGGTNSPLLIITSITSSGLTANGATINWSTNRAADSIVEYGVTSNYGNSMSVKTMQTSHTLTLVGLTPDTLYNFRVRSTDDSNNVSTSGNQTFTTAKSGTPGPTPTPAPGPAPTPTPTPGPTPPPIPTPTPFPVGGVDEFTGPFPSWKNAKSAYGAKGDGVTDDSAALQAALDELSNEAGTVKTLYISAGTYRITRTLRVHNTIFVNIIGEDPDFTFIRWDGGSGGVMLDIDGVAYSRFNRLTFDGRGVAQVAVDQSKSDNGTPHFDTGNEYAEDVFKDVAIGIRGGNEGYGAAETSVVRSRFIRNSQAGIILKNFNALDWWIWFSYFEDCATGVTNDPGAGNFHVYNSVFKRSTRADISIRNTGGFGIRNNYSIGSNIFYLTTSGGGNNGALTNIQGNTILDTTNPSAIQIGDYGPVQISDNFIRSKGSTGPAIDIDVADALAFDNTFSISSNQISAGGRFIGDGNKVGTIAATEPVIPFKYVPGGRRVFEVPVGASTSTIQQAINSAGALCGQRPIVHLPAGNYQVGSLVVPANCNIQIVGDGGATSLTAGSGVGTILTLQGPSKAILRDFRVKGSSQNVVNGIAIENADQSNSRVYMQGAFANSTSQNGLLVNGLSYTRVDLRDFQHQGTQGSGIKIVGDSLGGRTILIAGATSSNRLTYDITGGRFVAKDVWYETAAGKTGSEAKPAYMRVSGNAVATFEGGKIFTNATTSTPVLDIQNLTGNATFIGLDLAQDNDSSNPDYTLRISGTSTGSVLGLGLQARNSVYLSNNTSANARLINSRWYDKNYGTRTVTNIGSADVTWLRNMLTQTRGSNLTNEYEAIPAGITDVRIFRVYAENTIVGFQIKR